MRNTCSALRASVLVIMISNFVPIVADAALFTPISRFSMVYVDLTPFNTGNGVREEKRSTSLVDDFYLYVSGSIPGTTVSAYSDLTLSDASISGRSEATLSTIQRVYFTGSSSTSVVFELHDFAFYNISGRSSGLNTVIVASLYTYGPARTLVAQLTRYDYFQLYPVLPPGKYTIASGASISTLPPGSGLADFELSLVAAPTPVPLPAALPLFLAGVAGLVGVARRKRGR